MKVNEVGSLFQQNIVCKNRLLDATADPASIEESPRSMQSLDGCSYIVAVEDEETDVVLSDDDSVDASDTEWTITEFDFTGMTGATIVVTGATNPGNNGSFEVTAVTSAHVIETGDAVGLVDETFSEDVSITVIRTDAPLQATVLVEVSNDYVSGENTNFGQIPNEGNWVDLFEDDPDGPPAIDGGGYRWLGDIWTNTLSIRISVNATDGMGRVTVSYGGKGSL